VNPSLPSNWDGFAAEIERDGSKYRISVSKASNAEGYTLSINGSEVANPHEGYPVGQQQSPS
jgi:cyclic beta-1,2-glucan synthetase